jgi:hypothetical protein
MILSVAEFRPDAPDLADATTIAVNVVAVTQDSYGPIFGYVDYSTNALDSQPLGFAFGEDNNLLHHVYAGTATKLWTIRGAVPTWVDVTPAAGVNTHNEHWRFAQYKNLMIATDFSDPPQYQDMIAGGVFAPLSANPGANSTAPPQARYVAVAKDFLFLANINDASDGLQPQRLQWSGAGQPAFWPTPGTLPAQQAQSDVNDFAGPMGPITGLASSLQGCDLAVFFERGVMRATYAGPPTIFNFYPAMVQKGCIAPNSLCTLGTMCYYLGEDGFYQFDGYAAIPIGATKVDQWFFANVDLSTLDRVIGSPDIEYKAIVWLFRSRYALDYQHPNMALIYRWDLQRWSVAGLNALWVNRVPVSAAGEVPVVSGQLQLGLIGADLKLGFLTGLPMPARIGTKVMQLTPDARTFVSRSRPMINMQSYQSGNLLTEDGNILVTEGGMPLNLDAPVTTGNVSIALSARNNYFDYESFGADMKPDSSGDCPQRSEGRYHRARVTIAPSVWMRFAGVDLIGIKSGIR